MLVSEKAALVEDEEQQKMRDEDDEQVNILLPSDMEGENVPDKVDNADIEPEIGVTASDLGIQEVCNYY